MLGRTGLTEFYLFDEFRKYQQQKIMPKLTYLWAENIISVADNDSLYNTVLLH